MVHRARKMLEILLVCHKSAIKMLFQDVILKVSFKNATTFVAELLEVTAIPVRVTKWRRKPTFFTLVARAPDYLSERKRLQPKTSHLTFTLRQCLERAIAYLQSRIHWHNLTSEPQCFFGPRSFMSSKNTWGNTIADTVQYNRFCVGYKVAQNNKHFDVTNRTVRSLPRRNCGHSVKRA